MWPNRGAKDTRENEKSLQQSLLQRFEMLTRIKRDRRTVFQKEKTFFFFLLKFGIAFRSVV